MKAKRMSTTRRRRSAGKRNGSTTARNQTKYHRQTIGFERDVTIETGAGVVGYIAPGQYTTLPGGQFSIFSQNFFERFSPAWKSWRMLGWKCTVVVTPKPETTSDAILGIAPFNQGFNPIDGPFIASPPTFQTLCELPNVKMLSCDSANSKNRASFSYYNARRDINSLPFQKVAQSESPGNVCTPMMYSTGLQIFPDIGYTQTEILVRIYGTMTIEFKDTAYLYIKPIVGSRSMEDDENAPNRFRRMRLA